MGLYENASQVFAKAKLHMTAKEMEDYFNNYYKYLEQNSLEIEFKKLHFLKKKSAAKELEKLKNPKRNYLIDLMQMDSNQL